MRINLNQLYVFYLVARHKSMAAAAKLLFVSRPAITMQIKKIEEWLGFPVLERESKGLTLTKKGNQLFTMVESSFKHLEEQEKLILDMVQDKEHEIRLGTHHLPGNYFIPDLLAFAKTKKPNITIQMQLGIQDDLLEKMLQQKLDVILLIGKEIPEEKNLTIIPLFEEPLILVSSISGVFSQVDSISVTDLQNIPIILQQKGSGARRAVIDFLAAHGIEPNIVWDNLSSDVIKQFLPNSNACALVGRFIVQKELDEHILHEITITDASPTFQFYLAYVDTPYTPQRVKDFIAGISGFSPKFHN